MLQRFQKRCKSSRVCTCACTRVQYSTWYDVEYSRANYWGRKDQIYDGLDQIYDGLDQIYDGLDQIDDGLDQIDDGLDQIDYDPDQIDDGLDQIDDGLDQIDYDPDQIDDGLDQIDANYRYDMMCRICKVQNSRSYQLRIDSYMRMEMLIFFSKNA